MNNIQCSLTFVYSASRCEAGQKCFTVFFIVYSGGRHEAGEKWCALAMRLLHHLSTFQCNYQEKVQFFMLTIKCGLDFIENLINFTMIS